YDPSRIPEQPHNATLARDARAYSYTVEITQDLHQRRQHSLSALCRRSRIRGSVRTSRREKAVVESAALLTEGRATQRLARSPLPGEEVIQGPGPLLAIDQVHEVAEGLRGWGSQRVVGRRHLGLADATPISHGAGPRAAAAHSR